MGGHAASGSHFQVGRADEVLSLDSETGVGLVTGIGCDDELSSELLVIIVKGCSAGRPIREGLEPV